MLDPKSIYTVHALEGLITSARSEDGQPEAGAIQGPVLLHAIRGFVDAGSTGEMFTTHLQDQFSPQRLVDFDIDQLLSYRARRPIMSFEGDRWSDYEQPELAVDLLHDAEGTAFLLLHGMEPDLQWERFVAAVTEVIATFDVSLVVGVHGVPMGVPHTRPASSTGHATRAELLLPQPPVFGRLQVPSSASALLEFRLGEAGRDALGYAVHVPHYLAQGEYAPAAREAVQQVEKVTGLALESGQLDEAAREARDEINRQMAGSDEVRTVVEALEEQYDKFVQTTQRTTLLAESASLPTADELGAQFEQFLAEQDIETGVDPSSAPEGGGTGTDGDQGGSSASGDNSDDDQGPEDSPTPSP